MSKISWSLNQTTVIFIQENVFENVVCKLAAIFSGLNMLFDTPNTFGPFY